MSKPALGFGVGLRSPHYNTFLSQQPHSVDWLEILSENYLQAHQGYWAMLADLRAHYPMAMHGVSMSIGSTDPLDEAYLKALRRLGDFLEVAWVSDHLCFTGVNQENTHDLLPIPYTEEALKHLIPRIDQAQAALGRTLVFENASSYLEFDASTIAEPEFLNELHRATGCEILLDVNNVFVSCTNHGWDTHNYIQTINSGAVVQYHLAGHTQNQSNLLIDTHGAPVCDAVWQLYKQCLNTIGFRSTLIEWDKDIPSFEVLEREVSLARDTAQPFLETTL